MTSLLFNECSENTPEKLIESFNSDHDVLIKAYLLQLESYSWSWSGSEIPIIESRIDFFKELLKEIQKLGSNYIKHCMLENEKIKLLEAYKNNTIRDEFLREW